MIKTLLVLSLFILLLSAVESKNKQKVLKIVTDIKNQMVTMDDLKEIKDQIVDEVIDYLVPVIEGSCSCCKEGEKECPECPETECPETECPETECPETDCPGNNTGNYTETESKDCEDGWDYYPHMNKCYKHFSSPTTITWMDAQNTCRQYGGNLPTITDDETKLYIRSLTGGARIWIGAYRVGKFNANNQFAWLDGSPLVSYSWSSGEPNNDNDNNGEFCVEMYTSGYLGWKDNDCLSETTSDFVCQIEKSKKIKGECPDDWTYFAQTNSCYKLLNNPNKGITWMHAQYKCTRLGGDLAMILDEETDEFMYTVSNGSRAWIGAHRHGKSEGQWFWIDGSAMDYTNWNSSQPDNFNSDEFCTEMNAFGTWNDIKCSDSVDVFHYICQL